MTPPSIEMTNQRDQVKNSLFLANLVSTIVCESLKNHSETYYKVDPIFNIFYGQTVQGLSLVQSNLGYELHTPCGKLDIVMIKNHFRKDVQGATASAIAQSKDLTLVPFFGRIPLQSQRLDIVQSWKIQALQHSGRTYLLATSEYQHPQTYRHRSEIDPLIKEFHDSIKFSVEDD